jgi:hypothetical protein
MRPLRPLLCVACLGLVGCGPISDAWMTGWTQSSANDRIMLVRADPPSFGHRRLVMQARLYPDLSVFIGKRGLPGFLAELSNRDRHYLILYYLGDHQAFACRTRGAGTREVEFSGPYPITAKEYKTLEGFQREAERAVSRD